MAPSFAPNPMGVLQRRDAQQSPNRAQNPKKNTLIERLPTAPPFRLMSQPPLLRRSTSSASPREAPTPSAARGGSPRELLVLAHGLQGMVDDFKYLLESLHATRAASDGWLLIHASPVNQHKTHDGITLGGLRLAEDIRCVVAAHPSLQTISLVGFSLGGLYVRYAIGHLYNVDDGSIAGLQAGKVVMVASPNLGVRQFGVYRFIPEGIRGVVKQLVLGESTREVFLLDDELLLERMTRDDDAPFMKALKTFEKRVLYANIRQDFMVNYGTAALDTRMKGLNAEDVMRERAGEAVDAEYDERGCRIAFEFCIAGEGGDAGAGADEAGKRTERGKRGDAVEQVMAERLKRVGWRVVGVDFPVGLPVTHNRIVAMSRNAIHTWMNAAGRRAVHHLVDTVSRDFAEHRALFEPIH